MDSPRPSRQMPSIRRDRIAKTAPMPMTIADPLSHSERNVEYHGAACPTGSQLTMGRNPNADPSTAARTATQRQRDDSVGDSRLAKRGRPNREERRRLDSRLGLGRPRV